MIVEGIKKANFTVKDTGALIEGCNVYLSSPIAPADGKGKLFTKIYLSNNKAATLGI